MAVDVGFGTPTLWAILQAAAFWALALHFVEEKLTQWCTHDSFRVDCMHPEYLRRQNWSNTGVKVIVQGAGQTGTTSVTAALRELGYRSFHADDYSTYAKRVMYDKFTTSDWVATFSRCGIEALSLEPLMDMLPLLLQKSPDAKVVFTWRNYTSWVTSLHNNALKERRLGVILAVLHKSPLFIRYVEHYDRLTGHVKKVRLRGDPFAGAGVSIPALLYRSVCNGYAWPNNDIMNRGTRKIKAGEEAYLGMVNEARVHVPKDRLLEFDARRHGWPEFAKFMGVKPPPAGTSFPHPRSKNSRTNEEVFENNPIQGITTWMLLCAMHAINYWVIATGMQAAAFLLYLVAVCLGPLLTRKRISAVTRELATALETCPVSVVLEAAPAAEALQAAQEFADAGVCVVEVQLQSKGAVECIRLLDERLPKKVVVAAGPALTVADVEKVGRAGAAVVTSAFADAAMIRAAKKYDMVNLVGVCTPNEALAALQSGAEALAIFPGEHLLPEALTSWGSFLPKRSPLVLSWSSEPKRFGAYRAAGVSGFSLPEALLRSGKAGLRARIAELAASAAS